MRLKKNESMRFWVIGSVLLISIGCLLFLSQNQQSRLKKISDTKKDPIAESLRSRDARTVTKGPLSSTELSGAFSVPAKTAIKPKSDADFERGLKANKIRYRSNLDFNYERLYRKLALPDEKIDRLKDLMCAEYEQRLRAFQENRKRGQEPSADQFNEINKACLDSIKNFLGDDKYSIFQHYKDTIMLQSTVTATQSLLPTESRIPDDTAEAIVNAMLDAGMSGARMSEFNPDVLLSLSAILTPRQLEVFQNTCSRFYKWQPTPRN